MLMYYAYGKPKDTREFEGTREALSSRPQRRQAASFLWRRTSGRPAAASGALNAREAIVSYDSEHRRRVRFSLPL